MFSRLHHPEQTALPAGTVLHLADIEELHYILPIANLASVMEHGILSHRRVVRLDFEHDDVSAAEIQDRRALVTVPRADRAKSPLALHRHVNFYLNAHNAMMYVKRMDHENLCVLRIHREILERGDVMLSSRNSSTTSVSFFSPTEKDPLYSPRSAHYLTVERTRGYGEDKEEGKAIRQAEMLAPYQVDPSYIGGIFVSCENSQRMVQGVLESIDKPLLITVHPSLFFQGRTRYVALERFTPLPPLTTAERERLNEDLPESSDDEMSSVAESV